MDILKLTACEIISNISNGNLSCLQVAESLAEQYKIWFSINSLINFDQEQFFEAAQACDQVFKGGRLTGPLHGLPLVIKDNIDVVGFSTTAATPALENNIPTNEGPVIKKLRDAGAIFMAKANLHELAFTPGIAKNSDDKEIVWGAFGATRNPYDQNLSPSGSSSGTAAAISSGIAPAGLGTDTGGSVRNPSAWCGISGFRPTIRRYSQKGVVPVSWTRDTIGPMARTVEDLALIDGIITGEIEIEDISFSKLRFGLDRNFFCTSCDTEILNLFNIALDRLSDNGAKIIEIDINGLEELVDKIGHTIARYEVIRAIPQYLNTTELEIEILELFSQVTASSLGCLLDKLMATEAVSEEDYELSIKKFRPALQSMYREAFIDNNLDAILFPSTLVLPSDLNEQKYYLLGKREVPYLTASNHNVQPASIAGTPGLTLPIGLTPSGLPAALGFDGLSGTDRTLLSIGIAFQKLFPPIRVPKTIIQ